MPNFEDDAIRLSGEAYQVIASLAVEAGLFNHPEVQRALDYFAGLIPQDGSILPWGFNKPHSTESSDV